jgi:hypothetical protein
MPAGANVCEPEGIVELEPSTCLDEAVETQATGKTEGCQASMCMRTTAAKGLLLHLDTLADAPDGPTTACLLASSTMIEPGTTAPAFTRNDHLGRPLDMAALRGQRHLMLLFYPLDFTPT